jgi:hypothetical protein
VAPAIALLVLLGAGAHAGVATPPGDFDREVLLDGDRLVEVRVARKVGDAEAALA